MDKKSKFRNTYAGEYTLVGGMQDWKIRKGMDDGLWHTVDPQTGRNFDSHRTLREAKKWVLIYDTKQEAG